MAMESDNEQSMLRRVVGLKYETGSGLPRVILKGAGDKAREIIDCGRRLPNGPPLVEDKKLLEQLYRMPMDAEIGPELYELVAALLVHVYAVAEESRGSV